MQDDTRRRLIELRDQLDRLLDESTPNEDHADLGALLLAADELVRVLLIEVERARQLPSVHREQ